MRGIFITFEGCDGSGKTTQVNLLKEYLIRVGYDVVCTREPGGTLVGNEIRALLLNPEYSIHARAEALLYMAARAEHVDSLIRPALMAGKVVVSDRFADSTFVYQGVARKLLPESLHLINEFASDGVTPDLTIVLDGAVDDMQKRLAKRSVKDRMEQESLIFHRQVREGFLKLAQKEPKRVKVVSALHSIEQIHREVISIITEYFNRRPI